MLKEVYCRQIVPELLSELNLKNRHSAPGLKKIVVSVGVGKNKEDKKFIEAAINELAQITGQKPKLCQARQAISGFKLRKGDIVGLEVTLRGQKMWDFFEKLVNIALPRVRDFRGLERKAFDGRGNYTIGIKEHIVFPEIDPNKTDKIKSLGVSILTSAKNDEIGFKLLSRLGMPFRK